MSFAALPLPDPPLAGEGFALRPWAPADAAALAAAWADPEVARWTGVPAVHDEAAARRWIEDDARRRQDGASLDLVIDVAGAVAGEVGLAAFDDRARTADVGWWVAAPLRRRHLATRAVRAVADWATTELNIDAVVARCQWENPASIGVARAAGFSVRDDASVERPGEVVWCFANRHPFGGTVPL